MDFAFDPSGINPNFGGGMGLPVGKHPVTITKSEGKPTKGNDGGYIELTCTAFDGPAKGGSIAIRLNVHNSSEVAVKIAKEQLAAICAVTRTGPFQKTEELHNKPFVIEVVPQKGEAKYTEVGAVFDMDGNEPGKQSQQQSQGGGFQQGGGNQQQGGGFQQQGQGGGGGGFGGGATGTGSIPDQQQQQQQGGGNGGFGQGGGNGGGGGFGQQQGQQQQGGGGGGWQQGGGGAGAGGGGGSPGWGQR